MLPGREIVCTYLLILSINLKFLDSFSVNVWHQHLKTLWTFIALKVSGLRGYNQNCLYISSLFVPNPALTKCEKDYERIQMNVFWQYGQHSFTNHCRWKIETMNFGSVMSVRWICMNFTCKVVCCSGIECIGLMRCVGGSSDVRLMLSYCIASQVKKKCT